MLLLLCTSAASLHVCTGAPPNTSVGVTSSFQSLAILPPDNTFIPESSIDTAVAGMGD